ncbi:MAG: hypothetical protein HY362_00085 [Candidatus Aenigmarchaeota archaeon]|nr:hypothetical protein [Candidatus Aenigmarchaeota archaeon]
MGTTKREIEKEIYMAFADIASSIGYSDINGRILAALLVAGKTLSMKELAKEVGVSSAAISLSLDLLEFLGMIKKIKKVGDRNLYIELQGDLLDGLKRAFVIKIQKSVGDSLERFAKYRKELQGEENKDVLRTLNIIEAQVKRLNTYVEMLAKLKLP